MSSRRTALTTPVNFRISPEMTAAIRATGQSAGSWFREAGQQRLESEHGNDTPIAKLQGQVAALQKALRGLQENHDTLLREINRLQQSQAVGHEAVRRYMTEVEQRMSDALHTLGPTLLTALSQQLHHELGRLVQPERRPPDPPIPPGLQRRKL
jgi:hypothetical protein